MASITKRSLACINHRRHEILDSSDMDIFAEKVFCFVLCVKHTVHKCLRSVVQVRKISNNHPTHFCFFAKKNND
jgi:hypothetical protein